MSSASATQAGRRSTLVSLIIGLAGDGFVAVIRVPGVSSFLAPAFSRVPISVLIGVFGIGGLIGVISGLIGIFRGRGVVRFLAIVGIVLSVLVALVALALYALSAITLL
jgi:hypothetical protein